MSMLVVVLTILLDLQALNTIASCLGNPVNLRNAGVGGPWPLGFITA